MAWIISIRWARCPTSLALFVRDTNFQSRPYAWKKDLFNILYGTMPMWHIDRKLWDLHKKDMLASYRRIHSVRQRIGFAEMTDHGWLTPDRSVRTNTSSRPGADSAADRISPEPGARSQNACASTDTHRL